MADNYEILEEIGRGEGTVVYRAYDLSLRRHVAIKELDERTRKDPNRRQKFWEEAEFLASLEHENIVQVFSVDKERGWIILELMRGTLAQKLREGPLPPDLVRSVLRQTLEALDFLHEQQRIHGQVRPSNMLVNDQGRVKLSDFTATEVGKEFRRPEGTHKYMAPELLRPDEFGEVGPAVDIYCLGFTALELLVGPDFDRLFKGVGTDAIDPELGWLRWHSSPSELLQPARELIPNLPADLADVLDRMLAKRVEDRFQSVQEILTALEDRPLQLVQMSDEPAITGTMVGPAETNVREIVAPVEGGTSQKEKSAAKKPSALKQKKAKGKPARPEGVVGPAVFSREWFNEKLENPAVLYLVCGLIVLITLIILFWPGGDKPVAGREVTLATNPAGAKVFIDDAKDPLPDRTPARTTLAVGEHTVRVTLDGYEPLEQKVTVKAEDEKAEFPFTLTPLPPKDRLVRIETEPSGATIFLNGRPSIEKTPVEVRLPIGTAEVKLELEGYDPQTNSLAVVAGEGKQEVKYDLAGTTVTPPPAGSDKVALTVDPASAKVIIGEETFTPDANGNVQVPRPEMASLLIKATAGGFAPFEKTYTWDDLEKSEFKLNIRLHPYLTFVPPTAQITIDGKESGLVDGVVEMERNEKDSYAIRATAKGYEDFDKTLAYSDLAADGFKIALTEKPKPPAVGGIRELPDGRYVSAKLDDAGAPLYFVLIEPGSFRMGVSSGGLKTGELEGSTGQIDQPYYFATTEVTNKQYAIFAEEAGDDVAGTAWRAAHRGAETENMPVVTVSFDQAKAFCEWIGGKLPTEEQWERAARGTNGRIYPWGDNPPTQSQSNILLSSRSKGLVSVDELPDGKTPDGIQHLLGNAAEWCEAIYKQGFNDRPDDPGVGKWPTIRGGSYKSLATYARLMMRANCDPAGSEDVGFRPVVMKTGE